MWFFVWGMYPMLAFKILSSQGGDCGGFELSAPLVPFSLFGWHACRVGGAIFFRARRFRESCCCARQCLEVVCVVWSLCSSPPAVMVSTVCPPTFMLIKSFKHNA